MKPLTKSIGLILFLFIFLGSYAASAQIKNNKDGRKTREEQMAKMKSMKIAFISDNLELTPEEAEKFWPIYNEYEQKRDAITKDIMEPFEKMDEAPQKDMSNEEADKSIRMHFAHEQALLDLKTEYYDKYLQVLPASKIGKLYEVEMNFRRHLMGKIDRGDEERRPEERPERSGGTMHK